MANTTESPPVALYSFRRCPYAIRARMAIKYSQINIELHEVDLKNKPQAMLLASPKATVPVLILNHGEVIDESMDIIHWALSQYDPDHWLPASETNAETQQLITENDTVFKPHLDHYKYADRHPQHPVEYYRAQGELFLIKLENRLKAHRYLLGPDIKIADISIFPFIRQFAYVDKNWFDQAPYPHLQVWLEALLGSELFGSVMEKQKKTRTNANKGGGFGSDLRSLPKQ